MSGGNASGSKLEPRCLGSAARARLVAFGTGSPPSGAGARSRAARSAAWAAGLTLACSGPAGDSTVLLDVRLDPVTPEDASGTPEDSAVTSEGAAAAPQAGPAAPASGLAASDEGPPESVYQRERRTEISIELAPENWEALRYEGRLLGDAFEEVTPDYRYNEYRGTVIVDGVRYEDVEVRKKGFLGSLSALRPALRLDFERGGVELASGLRRLTLNNDLQDPSHARQCMAYDLFARAGLPASRCSFAHVVVNGKDLGTYSNVEPIRKPMLRRHFESDAGNLYEGTLADFDEESWQRFELESSEGGDDRSDVRAVVEALQLPDEALVPALESLVDLDQFRDFWALETLIGHWDGYAEIANNYYLYRDPSSDRFVFLPWGLDQAFMGARPNGGRPYQPTVYAGAALTRRLYALPEQRELFRQRLARLNDELWDAEALVEQANAIAALARDADAEALAAHREYLTGRSDELRAALLEPAPELDALDGETFAPPTCRATTDVRFDFIAAWQGAGRAFPLELTLDGRSLTASATGTVTVNPEDPAAAQFEFSAPLDEESGLILFLLMPSVQLQPGQYRFHSFETFGLLAWYGPGVPFRTLGFIGDGPLDIRREGEAPDAPLAGSAEARLYQLGCLQAPEAAAE